MTVKESVSIAVAATNAPTDSVAAISDRCLTPSHPKSYSRSAIINYLLADQIHRQIGKESLLPNYKGLIIDEAHKLHEAAQQMYGITIGPNDMSYLIESTRNLKGLRNEDQVLMKRLADDQCELFNVLKKSAHGLQDPESKINTANPLQAIGGYSLPDAETSQWSAQTDGFTGPHGQPQAA